MTRASGTLRCSYCDKTIEYRDSRLSRSTGYLVCWSCNSTPAVSEKPTCGSFYEGQFSGLKSQSSSRSIPQQKEGLLTQNLNDAGAAISAHSDASVSCRSASPYNYDSERHPSPLPVGSISLEQALAEFGVLEADFTSSAAQNLQNSSIDLDELVICEADRWNLTPPEKPNYQQISASLPSTSSGLTGLGLTRLGTSISSNSSDLEDSVNPEPIVW